VKSTNILLFTRVVALTISGAAACGGDATGGKSSAPDSAIAAGGQSAASSASNAAPGGQISAAGGQISAAGGRTAASSSTSTATCDSALASIGSTCPAVQTCMSTQCSIQLTACFGEADASGHRAGGECQSYTSCVDACSCNSSCMQNCSSQQTQTCRDCTTTVLDCVQLTCADETTQCVGIFLGTGGSPNGAGAGGSGSVGAAGSAGAGDASRHTCADLQACCTRLTGTAQTTCQTYYGTAASYGDSGCNLAWRSLSC
jgi:hypothetical protein